MQIKAAFAWTLGSLLHGLRHPSPPRTGRGRTALATALVVLVAAGVGGYFWQAAGSLPEDAVLKVGDRVVTVDELDERINALQAIYGVRPPTGDPQKMDRFRRDAAKSMAVALILQQQADQMGIEVPERDARNVLKRYIDQAFGTGPDARDEFIQALAKDGTSERVVLDSITRELTLKQLFARVTRDVSVTEQELRAAFPKYRDELGKPDTRRIRNIVVGSRTRAAEVMNNLRGGASFTELAGRYSRDGATRNKGGDLGFVSRDQLLNKYGQAAFSTPVGQTFGPIENRFGWNIGKVVEIRPGNPAEYAKVKDRLRALVEFQQRLDVWQSWLGKTIKQADVQYADEYRPANPNAVPSAGTGPALPGGQGGGQQPGPNGRGPR